MNDNDIITRSNGARYEYDADFDIYRRIPEYHELTHVQQWGWIYVSIILCIVSWIIAIHGA